MKMTGKFRWTSSWFLSVHIVLHLLLIFVRGNEETDDELANGKHLALEYFLPVNLPQAAVHAKEKRDVEGSGDEADFSEVNGRNQEKEWSVGRSNSSETAAAEKEIDEGRVNLASSDKSFEGSGEVDYIVSERERSSVPSILDDSEITDVDGSVVGVGHDESSKIEETTEMTTNENYSRAITAEEADSASSSSTESIKESDSEDESTEILKESPGLESSVERTSTEESVTTDSPVNVVEIVTVIPKTGSDDYEQTTKNEVEPTQKSEDLGGDKEMSTEEEEEETGTVIPPTTPKVPEISILESENPKESTTAGLVRMNTPGLVSVKNISSPEPSISSSPPSTEGILVEPVKTTVRTPVEDVFKETKISHEDMAAAPPGNILQKKNMTLGVDPLLIITNTRLVDSDDADSDKDDSRRLGAYIVIGLILLSFFSLVGYFIFKRRQYRKRQDFESSPESQDTEKALLSLTDYKDNSELEENHLKNNEITPIVVKSNSQINKFEKNTNFSSPKNLNTIANEKNIEKDNVLKSTTENLTQVIIEDSPKDLEEDKNAPCMEKLIVKTRLDPDSIPKKPIIVNRTSAGYIPIPKDIV